MYNIRVLYNSITAHAGKLSNSCLFGLKFIIFYLVLVLYYVDTLKLGNKMDVNWKTYKYEHKLQKKSRYIHLVDGN